MRALIRLTQRISLGFALAMVAAPCGRSWAQSTDDVASVQTECDAISRKPAHLTLSRGYRGRWRRYATSEHEESALLWLAEGQLRVAVTGVSGEDNSLEVAHCFRADGSLAQARSTLGTFYADPGPVRVERVFAYGADGQRLRFSERVFDGQGKRVTTDFARFALDYERVFVGEAQMRTFFGVVLARFLGRLGTPI